MATDQNISFSITNERERLLTLIQIQDDGCWRFIERIGNHGYGVLLVNDKYFLAHRLSYLIFNGPIPKGKIIDHKCHDPHKCVGGSTCPHRRCVNPSHLEISTHKDNTSKERSCRALMLHTEWQLRGLKAYQEIRKSSNHCIRGHEFTPENTRITKRGQKGCKKCEKIRHEIRRGPLKRSSTHCQRGHGWTPENTGHNGSKRFCIQCDKIKDAEYYQAKKIAKLM